LCESRGWGVEPQEQTVDAATGSPNLLAEAQLYRYSTEAEDKRAEMPVDDNNHALAALRYMISQLDEGKLGPRD
jgi:hypothetical protein